METAPHRVALLVSSKTVHDFWYCEHYFTLRDTTGDDAVRSILGGDVIAPRFHRLCIVTVRHVLPGQSIDTLIHPREIRCERVGRKTPNHALVLPELFHFNSPISKAFLISREYHRKQFCQ